MPSSFPGMNPYLEQEDSWQDFHETFIPALRDAISPQVSPHFIVKIEAHIFIHEPAADERIHMGNADVGVIRSPSAVPSEGGRATATIPATGRLRLPGVETEKQSYLEVRDRRNRELVTVIELLSPTNKRSGSHREQYLEKRMNVLRNAVHFVEID